eukprot:1181590-Rhodomonas_salina.1
MVFAKGRGTWVMGVRVLVFLAFPMQLSALVPQEMYSPPVHPMNVPQQAFYTRPAQEEVPQMPLHDPAEVGEPPPPQVRKKFKRRDESSSSLLDYWDDENERAQGREEVKEEDSADNETKRYRRVMEELFAEQLGTGERENAIKKLSKGLWEELPNLRAPRRFTFPSLDTPPSVSRHLTNCAARGTAGRRWLPSTICCTPSADAMTE